MKPVKFNIDKEKACALIDFLLNKALENLSKRGGQISIESYFQPEVSTEEHSIFFPSHEELIANNKDACALSTSSVIGLAAVGNLKLLRGWAETKEVDPYYLALLGYFSGYYMGAAAAKNDTDLLNNLLGPLAELGEKSTSDKVKAGNERWTKHSGGVPRDQVYTSAVNYVKSSVENGDVRDGHFHNDLVRIVMKKSWCSNSELSEKRLRREVAKMLREIGRKDLIRGEH